MKLLIIILLHIAYVVQAITEEDKKEWIKFKSTERKIYKNLQEEKLRFSIFQQNLREIEEHNKQFEAGETTYTKKVTTFADLTKEEFISLVKNHNTGLKLQNNPFHRQAISDDVPESIDWRAKGAVSEVRDQGMCAASWLFSVTGTLEGFNFVKTNKLVTLSGQQLIDCSTDDGCSGGDMYTVLQYVKEYGIETEDSYPYGDKSECRYNESAVFLRVNDFTNTEAKNEEDLVSAVGLLGPVSVTLDASELAFYQDGIFSSDDCSPDNINHAILAVGYGQDANTGLDYWFLKNSWGKNWGEDGYLRIIRGVNECGIVNYGVYPVL